MVAIVLTRKSTILRKASVKTLLRETAAVHRCRGMRVVTNDKHIAEQIKSDSTLSVQGNLLHSKVENVMMNGSKVGKIRRQQNLESIVMDGPKVGEFGKVEKEHNLKSIVMNGVKSKKGDTVKSVAINGGKSGKSGNCESDEETRSQRKERLCKSITRGLAKRNHERHTMLADVDRGTRTRRHLLRRHHRQGAAVACSTPSW